MQRTTSKGSKDLEDFTNERCELQMTPMIDVTFLLLIFFMCTLKFKVLEGALGAHLPKDVGVNVHEADLLEKVVVRMDVATPGSLVRPSGDGTMRPYTAQDALDGLRFQYASDRVLRYQVGPRSGLSQSEAIEALNALVKANPDARCSIDARDGVIQAEVVQVLDAFLAAGVQDVTFMGSRTSNE